MANSGSAAPEISEHPWGCNGCFVWGVLLVMIFGVIALFPWAQQFHISDYPNINGIYVSIALMVIAGIALMVLYSLRRTIPWLARLATLAFAVGLLVWLAASILSWLFSVEAG
jgi:hypothetical protein